MKRTLIAAALLLGCTPPAPPQTPLPPPSAAPDPSPPPAPSASATAAPIDPPPPLARQPVAPVPAAAPCVAPSSVETVSTLSRDAIVDDFSLDGETLATRIMTKAGTTLALYKVEGYGMAGSAELEFGAIAWSYDGSRQILVKGNHVLLRDDKGGKAPIEGAAPPSPNVQPPASMSHDGRFLVIADQPVIFDLIDKKKLALPDPPIAGGSDPTFHIDATGRLIFAENSRTALIGAVTYDPDFHVTWSPSSSGALASRDGSVLLSVPRRPFAQDWVPTFDLSGKLTSQLPLHLTPKDRFAAALCPAGNLVAVAARGALGFYDAATGQQVWKKPFSQVSKNKPNALTKGKGGPDRMLFSPKGNLLWVRTGNDELLLRLVP
jgi:hypothetical protein